MLLAHERTEPPVAACSRRMSVAEVLGRGAVLGWGCGQPAGQLSVAGSPAMRARSQARASVTRSSP